MPITNVTRSDFIDAIKNFKKQHNIKLKELFDQKNTVEKLITLRKEFFANEVINGYLARSSSQVAFLENRPDLKDSDNKEDRANSDHHELKIYKLSSKRMVAYRYFADTDDFAEKGVLTYGSCGNTKTVLDKHFLQLANTFNVECYLTVPMNIYDIRMQLDEREWHPNYFDKQPIKFILNSIYKDHHSSTILHIMKDNKVMISIFINSSKDRNYTTFIKEKFNLDSNTFHASNSAGEFKSEQELKSLISETNFIELDSEKEIWFCKDLKLAIAFKCDDEWFNYEVRDKVLEFMKNNNIVIDKILTPSGTYFLKRTIPFLDASHDLQLQTQDKGCGLYSLNFIKAIRQLLNNQEKAREIYNLALSFNCTKTTGEFKKIVADQLQNIFAEELKDYLLSYYTDAKKQKPYHEIKKFHKLQRWDLDSERFVEKSYELVETQTTDVSIDEPLVERRSSRKIKLR